MNRKGFTLIELLIVVVIIGILAAIAIPRFGETRERAYVSAMQSDINQLRTAMEMCYQDDFSYDGCDGGIEGEATGYTNGVILDIDAGEQSWSVDATHTASDSWSCSYDSDEGIIECEQS